MTTRPFRFGVTIGQARSVAAWIGFAQRAEALGYATLLMPETLGQTWDPLTALATAAAATQRIRLGTYVLANDLRNPVLLARTAATLDVLSDGRFELGLGAGYQRGAPVWRRFGTLFDAGQVRVARLAEALAIITSLLQARETSTSGTYYTVAGAEIFPVPLQQPHPPILIAGAGTQLLAVAAHDADCIALAVPPQAPPQVLATAVDTVRQAAGARFDQIELNHQVIGVGHGPWPIVTRLGLNAAQLRQSGSPAVMWGTPAEMCEQLLERRHTLGISYITVPDVHLDACAPVVERLAGV